MVKINKIYTKNGDQGDTHLVGGTSIKKSSLRVDVYGEVDSLNSCLGMIRTLADKNQDSDLTKIIALLQNDLFDIGSILASDPKNILPGLPQIGEAHVTELEKNIDAAIKDLPELTSFVLPGGTELNSWLHIARTTCRKVERMLWGLQDSKIDGDSIPKQILIYLNRLSDLFFALARRESFRSCTPEYLWITGGHKAL